MRQAAHPFETIDLIVAEFGVECFWQLGLESISGLDSLKLFLPLLIGLDVSVVDHISDRAGSDRGESRLTTATICVHYLVA